MSHTAVFRSTPQWMSSFTLKPVGALLRPHKPVGNPSNVTRPGNSSPEVAIHRCRDGRGGSFVRDVTPVDRDSSNRLIDSPRTSADVERRGVNYAVAPCDG